MHLQKLSLLFAYEAHVYPTVQQSHHGFFSEWLDLPDHHNWDLNLFHTLSSQLGGFHGFPNWHNWFREGSAHLFGHCMHLSGAHILRFLALAFLETWYTWQGSHMLAC